MACPVLALGHDALSLILMLGERVGTACLLVGLACLHALLIAVCTVLSLALFVWILGITVSLSKWYGNTLPSLGLTILLYVIHQSSCTTSIYNWSSVLALVGDLNHRELRKISEEQQNLKNQMGDLLNIHWDQSEEIAEWAEIPRAIFGDRINRHKAILGMQQRAIKIELRRELYSRFIQYLVVLEERKRGQQFSWRDFWLAVWIQAYCINLWIFDMAFSSIWAVLGLFESFFALATEPWGVGLKLIITH